MDIPLLGMGLVGTVVTVGWLDLMILRFSSNLNGSVMLAGKGRQCLCPKHAYQL